jgi:hypothetical protein
LSFLLPRGACGQLTAVLAIAQAIDRENCSLPGVQQQAFGMLCDYIREGRLRAYIMSEYGEVDEAQPAQFAGMENRVLFRDWLRGFRTSNGRRMSGMLFFYESDLAAVVPKNADDPPIVAPVCERRGRTRTYDPELVGAEISRLMDYHGEFSALDRKWKCQARLEEALQEFCKKKFGTEPARSTLQNLIKRGLAEWREKKRLEGEVGN